MAEGARADLAQPFLGPMDRLGWQGDHRDALPIPSC